MPLIQKQKLLLRLSLLLSVLTLMVSLTCNIFLFVKGRYYYLKLNSTNLDPLGLGAFSTEPPASNIPTASTATVVFFGDSRAQMWSVPANLKGFSFINRGIDTQTSTQVLGRFDQHIVPLNPDIIIIQVGINDLKTIPLFPQEKAAIINNCKANIKQIKAVFI